MNRFQSLVHGGGSAGIDGGTTFIDNGGGSAGITGEFSGIDPHTTVKPVNKV